MKIDNRSGCQLPKITIVIPYYMGWNNLVNTLRAVLTQQYPQNCYEIIVLNDGGSPSWGKWPSDIQKDRVVWIDNENRLGMVKNWNKAMQVGQHQWIWLLHSDDLPYNDFLVSIADAINEYPDAGMVHTKPAFWSNNPKSFLYWRVRIQYINRKKRSPIRYDAGVNAIRHVMSGVVCSSVVIHRDSFKLLGGFDLSFPYSADEDFWPRLAQKFPVVYIPRRLIRYLFHSKQTSAQTKYSEDFWEQYRAVNFKTIEYLGLAADDQDWIRLRNKLCRVAINLSSKFAFENQIPIAKLYLIRAIAENQSCSKWPLFQAARLALKHRHLGQVCMEATRWILMLQHKLSY